MQIENKLVSSEIDDKKNQLYVITEESKLMHTASLSDKNSAHFLLDTSQKSALYEMIISD